MFTNAALALASFISGILSLCFTIAAAVGLLSLLMILPFKVLRRFRQRRIDEAVDYDFAALTCADPLPGEFGHDPQFPTRAHYPNGMEHTDPDDADL